MNYTNVSIDRISITADITINTAQLILAKILDDRRSKLFSARSLHSQSFTRDSIAFFEGSLFYYEKNFSGVYVNFDLFRGNRKYQRNFKIEYNPNKISANAKEYINTYIFPSLENARYSRLDLAFDINKDLSQYYFKHNFEKIIIYQSIDSIETIYFGSESSNKRVKVYDKNKERKVKNRVLKPNFEEFWRVEFVLKQKEVRKLINDQSFDPFKTFKIKTAHNLSKFSGPTYFILKGLIDDPTSILKLSRNSRSKYKKLLGAVSSNDLTPIFQEKWQQKKPLILKELNDLF